MFAITGSFKIEHVTKTDEPHISLISNQLESFPNMQIGYIQINQQIDLIFSSKQIVNKFLFGLTIPTILISAPDSPFVLELRPVADGVVVYNIMLST